MRICTRNNALALQNICFVHDKKISKDLKLYNYVVESKFIESDAVEKLWGCQGSILKRKTNEQSSNLK